MARIGILGAGGRMGQAIARAVAETGATLAGGTDRPALVGEVGGIPFTDAATLAAGSDVLIDFSTPAALAGHLDIAAAAGIPIVIGTTGLGADDHARIDAAAQVGAVLQAANMSLGVNLLAHLVRETARRLGSDWDIEIVEMHHRHKVDAPSGTALLLGEAAADGRGVALADASVRSRDGITGARPEGTIGFATLRGGSVAGDHQVIFAAEGERLELGHRAESRAIFATGAVKAALWLAGRPAGRYAITDVLGLR
ncbi:4-hydroxy-tetrahydrodipicolinate reductase [Sphingomonas solaris]|uniref:4-hydroxy-tetrahydrodipicolinate reductase n=1 Tax=Alterirhizorhabdus solaris TaxID=2529389 RepID=A0A558R6I2_9SPHN|nr:4-hydroxy-tetrahydrodipicolinate reductase [Sphingomonas solaris]TVV74995.1 4-hydroxy-tetrahydrodipicolinate reductase [Sphingomonas solaris]